MQSRRKPRQAKDPCIRFQVTSRKSVRMAKIKEMFAFVKSLAVKVKNDFVNAACKPLFIESACNVIAMFLKYALYTSLVLCTAFVMFIAALIVVCVICNFPLTCGFVMLGLLLLLLVVKLVRVTHKDLVEEAKRERERGIDAIVAKWSKRHAS